MDIFGRAFAIASDCKLRQMAAVYALQPDVLLLQPDIGEHVYALDFSHGRRLIRAGYEYARPLLQAWLRESGLAEGAQGRSSV